MVMSKVFHKLKKISVRVLPIMGIVAILCSFLVFPSSAVNYQSVEITPAMIGVLLDSGILDCYMPNFTINAHSQGQFDLNQYFIHTYDGVDYITIYSDQVPLVIGASRYAINIQLSFDFDFYLDEQTTYNMMFWLTNGNSFITYQYVRVDSVIEQNGTSIGNFIEYKPTYSDTYFDTYFNNTSLCKWGSAVLPVSGSLVEPYNALGFYSDYSKGNVGNYYAIPAFTISSFTLNLDVDSFETTSDETTSDGGGSGGDNAAIVAALNQLHQDLDDINSTNQEIQADVVAVKNAISTPNQHQEDVLTSFENYESSALEEIYEYHSIVSSVENGVRNWVTSGWSDLHLSTDELMPTDNSWFDPFVSHRTLFIIYGIVGVCALISLLLYGRS